MWFAYLDESKENNSTYIYSALIMRGEAWPKAFRAVKEFRKELRKTKAFISRKNYMRGSLSREKDKFQIVALTKQSALRSLEAR